MLKRHVDQRHGRSTRVLVLITVIARTVFCCLSSFSRARIRGTEVFSTFSRKHIGRKTCPSTTKRQWAPRLSLGSVVGGGWSWRIR